MTPRLPEVAISTATASRVRARALRALSAGERLPTPWVRAMATVGVGLWWLWSAGVVLS